MPPALPTYTDSASTARRPTSSSASRRAPARFVGDHRHGELGMRGLEIGRGRAAAARRGRHPRPPERQGHAERASCRRYPPLASSRNTTPSPIACRSAGDHPDVPVDVLPTLDLQGTDAVGDGCAAFGERLVVRHQAEHMSNRHRFARAPTEQVVARAPRARGRRGRGRRCPRAPSRTGCRRRPGRAAPRAPRGETAARTGAAPGTRAESSRSWPASRRGAVRRRHPSLGARRPRPTPRRRRPRSGRERTRRADARGTTSGSRLAREGGRRSSRRGRRRSLMREPPSRS